MNIDLLFDFAGVWKLTNIIQSNLLIRTLTGPEASELRENERVPACIKRISLKRGSTFKYQSY